MAANPDEEFFKRADVFLNAANDMITTTHPGKISASVSFAAARFNAWFFSQMSKSKADMEAQSEDMIKQFTEQYERMLRQHIADHLAHWDSDHK
jgi:hypothetical protein